MPPPNPSNDPTIPAAIPMTNVKNRFSSKFCVNRSNSLQESNKWFGGYKKILRILIRELL